MALALVGVGLRLQTMVNLAKDAVSKQQIHLRALRDLETMHEHADDYGFGTKATNEQLKGLIEAFRESVEENRRISDSLYRLVHYIKFDIKGRTGQEPPPPPPNGVR